MMTFGGLILDWKVTSLRRVGVNERGKYGGCLIGAVFGNI